MLKLREFLTKIKMRSSKHANGEIVETAENIDENLNKFKNGRIFMQRAINNIFADTDDKSENSTIKTNFLRELEEGIKKNKSSEDLKNDTHAFFLEQVGKVSELCLQDIVNSGEIDPNELGIRKAAQEAEKIATERAECILSLLSKEAQSRSGIRIILEKGDVDPEKIIDFETSTKKLKEEFVPDQKRIVMRLLETGMNPQKIAQMLGEHLGDLGETPEKILSTIKNLQKNKAAA